MTRGGATGRHSQQIVHHNLNSWPSPSSSSSSLSHHHHCCLTMSPLLSLSLLPTHSLTHSNLLPLFFISLCCSTLSLFACCCSLSLCLLLSLFLLSLCSFLSLFLLSLSLLLIVVCCLLLTPSSSVVCCLRSCSSSSPWSFPFLLLLVPVRSLIDCTYCSTVVSS